MARNIFADQPAKGRNLFADTPPPQAPPTLGDMASDVGQSAVQGAKNLWANTVGGAGDISDVLRGGMSAIGIPTRTEPLDQSKMTLPGGFTGLGAMPSSETVQHGMGPSYVPKTIPGATIGSAVELAPIIAGAPSLLRGGASLVKGGVNLARTGADRLVRALSGEADAAAAPVAHEIRTGVTTVPVSPKIGEAQQNAALATQNANQVTSESWRARQAQQAAEAEAAKRSRIVKGLQIVGRNTQPNIETIGTVRNPSEIGAPLQSAALQNETNIASARGRVDAELRSARDAVVTDREAKGETIKAAPTYQTLMDRLKSVLSPNKISGPDILSSTNPDRRNLYQQIMDRVGPQKTPLTAEEYRAAEAAGKKVSTGIGPNGEEIYYRVQTPSFHAVDETRRFLGQAFADPKSGYGAIADTEKKAIYGLLDSIEKEYVGGGTQSALQQNWRDAAERLQTFETKAGKTLTAEQGATGELRSTPSDIPGAFFGKGAGKLGQLQTVTGNPALVQRSAADWVASQLAGKTGTQAAQALGPQRQLADMLSHPTVAPVQRNVQAYVRALNASERTAGRVASESKGLTEAQKAAATAGEQTQNAQTAAQKARDAERAAKQNVSEVQKAAEDAAYARAAKYDRMAPRDIVSNAKNDIAADLKAQRITKAQHDEIYRKIDEADRLHGKTDAARKQIKTILKIGAAAGVAGGVIKGAHIGGL